MINDDMQIYSSDISIREIQDKITYTCLNPKWLVQDNVTGKFYKIPITNTLPQNTLYE